ncbi:hypothetical protein EJ06DRAFT_531108 [Trichodelitschia bisporula]|uniref:N(6)-L-threonylcarbamoyladenine synthase n=1 Tax=Trichodelitschia bisporula TaxID=703511 RepID=A0A6G1HUM4_9PEZI|nr:hypothetical protein EJ06DRAFT_531108 [Trichodelitschia bisporula]
MTPAAHHPSPAAIAHLSLAFRAQHRSLKPRRLFPPPSHQNLLTLAIETSCDDTAVAILEKSGARARLHFSHKISSNNVAYHGIHPVVALESHQENLSSLVQKALHHLPHHDGVSPQNVVGISSVQGSIAWKQKPDFIAVTRGPGMRSNLANGIDTAKGLAVAWQIPLVGVHHMQAHALTPRLVSALEPPASLAHVDVVGDTQDLRPIFPFMSLLVSGGHTLLLRCRSITEHEILASTADCAIGDCIDKVSRAILPDSVLSEAKSVMYGPLLERFVFKSPDDYHYTPPANRREEVELCQAPGPFGWPFPTPLTISSGGRKWRAMEFSFTGLVTYTSRLITNGWDTERNKPSQTPRTEPISEAEARWIARECMRSAFEHLASRAIMALEEEVQSGCATSQTLVLSGGVAANGFLRHVMRSYLDARGFSGVQLAYPPVALCTDNAAMIAWAGCEMFEAGHSDSLRIRALRKWSLENILHPEREEGPRDPSTGPVVAD